MPNILLAYRCFRGDTLSDYDLHNATIYDLGHEDGQNLIYFKPMAADHCKPVWMHAKELDMATNYVKGEPLNPDSVPLSKEAYEASFPRQQLFASFPYYTNLFTRNLRTANKPWVPIPECATAVRRAGNAKVHPKCAQILQRYKDDIE